MNVLFCSCVILINKNNEILICQRPKGKFMDGFWEFPGGKVKNSEKFNYAAIREIQEELNIKIDAKDINFLMNIFYEYSDFFLSMQVYFTDQWQGKIKAMEKHIKMLEDECKALYDQIDNCNGQCKETIID